MLSDEELIEKERSYPDIMKISGRDYVYQVELQRAIDELRCEVNVQYQATGMSGNYGSYDRYTFLRELIKDIKEKRFEYLLDPTHPVAVRKKAEQDGK